MVEPAAPTHTILIVDDDPPSRTALAAQVVQFGFAVIEVGSGREALRTVSRERVDAVLLDVVMPDVYGIDVLMQIKADPRTENVPVLVMTGLSDRDMRLSVLAAGAEEMLAKPVDALELRARLRNVLRTRSPALAATPNPRVSQPIAFERPARRAVEPPVPAAHGHDDELAACWRAAVAAFAPPMLSEVAPRLLLVRPDGQLVPPLAEALYLTDLGADLIGRERLGAAQRAAAAGRRQDLRCVVRTMGMCTLRVEPVQRKGAGGLAVTGLVVAILPDR